ncbi:protein YkfC-like [Dermacentor silvarum]|uniref:protein YkfC-like n=1 Tax=Dermacentor silvarum TaxID=543639 RepID=UPI00189AF626|nr:protein YkfC-like [Dermacentor silvarum]
MNRWQHYLEESELYPNSIIGFRNKLGTQDAMILLKNEIIDDMTGTKDNRAILGLDLQSSFDKVRHSAILAQVSRLNMGRKTYEYIKDFLTERTTEICAGDLQLEEKKLGSVGTPQGSVISPLLFNLVMIGVANRLERVTGVRHNIYADDVTLWVPGESDEHIKTTLQEAVNAIEEQLDGIWTRLLWPSQSCS